MSEAGKIPIVIRELENRELAVVSFVQDYIQLLLQVANKKDYILTTYTLPVVGINKVEYRPCTAGYRDALCALIGRRIQKAEVDEGVELRVGFLGDGALMVSLREEDYNGPEAAMLSDGENFTVW